MKKGKASRKEKKKGGTRSTPCHKHLTSYCIQGISAKREKRGKDKRRGSLDDSGKSYLSLFLKKTAPKDRKRKIP